MSPLRVTAAYSLFSHTSNTLCSRKRKSLQHFTHLLFSTLQKVLQYFLLFSSKLTFIELLVNSIEFNAPLTFFLQYTFITKLQDFPNQFKEYSDINHNTN